MTEINNLYKPEEEKEGSKFKLVEENETIIPSLPDRSEFLSESNYKAVTPFEDSPTWGIMKEAGRQAGIEIPKASDLYKIALDVYKNYEKETGKDMSGAKAIMNYKLGAISRDDYNSAMAEIDSNPNYTFLTEKEERKIDREITLKVEELAESFQQVEK